MLLPLPRNLGNLVKIAISIRAFLFLKGHPNKAFRSKLNKIYFVALAVFSLSPALDWHFERLQLELEETLFKYHFESVMSILNDKSCSVRTGLKNQWRVVGRGNTWQCIGNRVNRSGISIAKFVRIGINEWFIDCGY